MVPQQDVIYLDLTSDEVDNPSEELKKQVLDYYKKGTILWVVLRVTFEGYKSLLPYSSGFYTNDNTWTFYFGAEDGVEIAEGRQ